MAGYVGNLISYHDRREGELSEFGACKPGTIGDGTGPGCDAGKPCRSLTPASGTSPVGTIPPPRRSSSQTVGRGVQRAGGVLR